jgi:hypothetical protein
MNLSVSDKCHLLPPTPNLTELGFYRLQPQKYKLTPQEWNFLPMDLMPYDLNFSNANQQTAALSGLYLDNRALGARAE